MEGKIDLTVIESNYTHTCEAVVDFCESTWRRANSSKRERERAATATHFAHK